MTAHDWEETAKEVQIAKLPRKVGELVFDIDILVARLQPRSPRRHLGGTSRVLVQPDAGGDPLLVLVTLGVRRGELLGLTWPDVDLEEGRVSVRRTLEESSAGVAFKEPKTARGARTIALPAITGDALREHRKAQCEMRLRVGPGFNSHDLVFPGADGELWWPANFGRACRRVFKKAGLECRIHDVRHTHATMLLRQGVHPKAVQERLGHANVGITLDTYSHVMPGMQEEAAVKIDAGLRAAVRACAELQRGGVTVSGGAAAWAPGELPGDLLRRADDALYAAKHSGGDAVTRGDFAKSIVDASAVWHKDERDHD